MDDKTIVLPPSLQDKLQSQSVVTPQHDYEYDDEDEEEDEEEDEDDDENDEFRKVSKIGKKCKAKVPLCGAGCCLTVKS